MSSFLNDVNRDVRPFEFFYVLFYKARLQDHIAKSTLNQYAMSGIPEAEVFMMITHLFAKESDKVLSRHIGKTAVPWLETRFLALQDHREIGPAAWALGMAFSEGLGPDLKEDHEVALKFFKLSADVNHPAGCNSVGNHFRTPKTTDSVPDSAEAIKWYHRAAAMGHASAKYNLGDCYFEGVGVEKDMVEAVRWYTIAAEEGHSGAQNDLAWCYDHGHGVEQNSKAAVHWFRRSQEGGDPEGTFNLAVSYETGRGVPRDEREALRLYRLAADNDHGISMVAIGLFYEDGKGGLLQSYEEAARWFRRAADMNCPEGQYNLAICYENGNGIEQGQNLEEAARYYRLAADQGLPDAQINLGTCYVHGTGVERNWDDAATWYLKAAMGENKDKELVAEAQYNYGCLLRQLRLGWFTEHLHMSEDKKIGTDVEWFLKAAEQDYCYAQYSLALHYLKMSYIEASEEDEESTQYTDASEDEDTDNNDEKSSEEIVIEHPTEGDASINNNDDEYVSLEDEATALMWLRRALVQLYLDENLSEKLEDDEFVSRCIEKSVIGALELCLEMGMDMNSVLRDMDSTPLQMSVSCNSPAIIRLLIEHGVDINVTDVPDLPDTFNNSPNTRRFFEQVIGETQLAIAQACRHNSHEAMLLLLDAGVDTQLVEGAMNATRTAFFKMDSTSIAILNSRLDP